jgi:hypothetical protein
LPRGRFCDLDDAEAVAMRLRAQLGPAVLALGRVVFAAGYRNDSVMLSLGREPRPPFPKGHVLPAGDWSLLEVLKGRAHRRIQHLAVIRPERLDRAEPQEAKGLGNLSKCPRRVRPLAVSLPV